MSDQPQDHPAIQAILNSIRELKRLYEMHTGDLELVHFTLPYWAKVALEREGIKPYQLEGLRIDFRS
jgi:hypothetical protein